MGLWGNRITFKKKFNIMKSAIILFAFATLLLSVKAQVTPPPPLIVQKDTAGLAKDSVGAFEKVEVEAEFTGGDNAWRSFLMKNLDIDKISDKVKFPKRQKVFKQTVIVKFIVCTDGSLCDIAAENKVDPLIKAEAERVLKISPNWVPARQNGKPVKAYRRQPITVLIERE
jgi:protein TonB